MNADLDARASRVEAALDRLTAALSWVWLALISVIVVAVVLRYAFGIGLIELEELQWHLYSFGLLMGLVACTTTAMRGDSTSNPCSRL